MNGLVSQRLKNDIKFNRFVNTRGLPYHNKEMDLTNEHLNNDYDGKETYVSNMNE